jgi:hypothetical protein
MNDLFWSTEIAYGFVLHDDELEKRKSEWTHIVLQDITAEAWYPTVKGKKEHYREKIAGFLAHVKENTAYLYSATIVLFSSAFEAYLKSIVRAGERVSPVPGIPGR